MPFVGQGENSFQNLNLSLVFFVKPARTMKPTSNDNCERGDNGLVRRELLPNTVRVTYPSASCATTLRYIVRNFWSCGGKTLFRAVHFLGLQRWKENNKASNVSYISSMDNRMIAIFLMHVTQKNSLKYWFILDTSSNICRQTACTCSSFTEFSPLFNLIFLTPGLKNFFKKEKNWNRFNIKKLHNGDKLISLTIQN